VHTNAGFTFRDEDLPPLFRIRHIRGKVSTPSTPCPLYYYYHLLLILIIIIPVLDEEVSAMGRKGQRQDGNPGKPMTAHLHVYLCMYVCICVHVSVRVQYSTVQYSTVQYVFVCVHAGRAVGGGLDGGRRCGAC